MKRHVITALAALTFTLSMFACYASAQTAGNWDQYGFAPSGGRDNIYETVLGVSNVYSLKANWTFNGSNAYLSSTSVAVDSGLVFFPVVQGELCAADVNTGNVVWTFTNGFPPGSSPTVANGLVYAWFQTSNNAGALYALNENTGAVVWSSPTSGTVRYVTAANGVLYFGIAGTVYAVSASTGSALWDFQTTGTGVSAPAVANGAVYVTSANENLYALNANSGAEQWQVGLSGAPGTPVIVNGELYVQAWSLTTGSHVWAYVAATGRVLWGYYLGNAVVKDLAVANGVVYFGTGGPFYALNATTGALKWTFNASVSGVPAVANGVVYIGTTSQYFYALNAATGAQLLRYNLGVGYVSYSSGIPVVASGVLYIPSVGPYAPGMTGQYLFHFTPK
jgi:outer membrane protein assembly factor BamB